ncbi:MAG: hypothetical protein QOH61_1970 [Chloroflexota bacterium]|nr:hypothetical protein [Chloroflexota bacterium]
MAGLGWTVLSEVTFAVYGERGSIDLLAVRPLERIAAVFEIKTGVASWEETQRRFDVKVRLLPTIIFERLSWKPIVVARILVFEEGVTSRRRLSALGPIVAQAFPASSRQVRAWLRRPNGALAGIWFLSASHARTRGRVRRPRTP